MLIHRRNFIELTAGAASAAMLRVAAAEDGAPLLVTGDSVDPKYAEPVIEVNEERNDPEPHRYVHGGFKGTPGKFSFYFPTKARYQGRFFHNTYPLIINSDVGPSPIGFKINEGDVGYAFASGAYYVQTNQGGSFAVRADPDPSISSAYRLNAAAAKYSRVVAAEIYGGGHRPYGYIHGGSGGSYQVMGCAENTSGVWDGFLPYVLGSPYALAGLSGPSAYVRYVLNRRNKFPGVVDALDPGGSGDPYADLNDVERAALREAQLAGFPMRGWWQYDTVGGGGGVQNDPTYTDDFWSKAGYAGADQSSPFREWRVQLETSISKATAGPPATVELASVPDRDFAGAQLLIVSGAAAGKSQSIGRIDGKTITLGGAGGGLGGFLGGGGGGDVAASLRPGDQVRIDNSSFLASLTYHRHNLPPSTEYYAWNQFRGPDGKPLYPQRPHPMGPTASISTVGSLINGHVNGKVLVMEAMMDIFAYPWQADWYRLKVKEALGRRFEDNFVLWFVDNAQHDVPGHFGTQGVEKRAWARTISAVGVLQQGLRDLSAWVEKGVRPPDTRYSVVDTQVHVPTTARERGGIQPVVTLQANGGVHTEVAAGKPVKFAGTIEVPFKAGKVIAVEWDFEGVGEAQAKETLRTPQSSVHVSNEYTYSKPGTYFAVLRVFSQREGDVQTPYARVQNLARVRVLVG